MRYLLPALLLLLTACSAGYVPDPAGVLSAQAAQAQALPTDLNVAQGMIDGARKSTAEAAERSYQATRDAWQQQQLYFDATQTAIIGVAMAQTQQAAAGTATQAVANQATAAQSTAVAVIVAGADFAATQAQRPLDRQATEVARELAWQATATQIGVERDNAESAGTLERWLIGGIGIAAGAVIVVILWLIGAQGRRIAKAKADQEEAEALKAKAQAERERYMPMSWGVVVVGERPLMLAAPGHALPANTSPVVDAVYQPEPQINSIKDLLRLAQYKTGDTYARYIPRYDKLGLNSPEPRGEYCQWLEEQGYVRVTKTGTICVEDWNLATMLDDIEQKEADGRPSPTFSVSPMRTGVRAV